MIGVGEVHRLTVEDFELLASARPGAGALDVLHRSQLSWRLLTLHAIAALGRERQPALWRDSGAEQARELLEAVDRADRQALESVMMHPLLGVLLARCLRRLVGPPDAGLEEDLARLGAVAVAAALRAGLPVSLRLPVHGDRLALPTWGVARLPAGTRSLRVEGATLIAPGFTVRLRAHGPGDPPLGSPGWLPLRSLTLPPSDAARGSRLGTLRISLEDGDPDRHTGEAGSADRLTQYQVGDWRGSLRGAWQLLTQHFPDRAAVCASLCSTVVPLVPPPGCWATSASREAFGAVWLSPTTDTVLLAEALVHEVSHVLLGALGDLVDLHDPDDTGSHMVGWRPDPRPLGAVLQGTYAHVARLDFWDRYRRIAPPAEAERADRYRHRLRGQVMDALELLDGCAGLTELGRRFCERMADGVAPHPGHMTSRYSNG